MTWSELDWRLKAIAKRRDDENRFNAALHGIDLKRGVTTGSKNNPKQLKLTNKKKVAIDKAIEQAKKRILKNGN